MFFFPFGSTWCAHNLKEEIPTTGSLLGRARPQAKASEARRPVKLPGPLHTEIFFISSMHMPAP